MSIKVNLDVVLAQRKMSLTSLSYKVGLTLSNLSNLKSGKAKAIRFSTLSAICKALDCQPADILEYQSEQPLEKEPLFKSKFQKPRTTDVKEKE